MDDFYADVGSNDPDHPWYGKRVYAAAPLIHLGLSHPEAPVAEVVYIDSFYQESRLLALQQCDLRFQEHCDRDHDYEKFLRNILPRWKEEYDHIPAYRSWKKHTELNFENRYTLIGM